MKQRFRRLEFAFVFLGFPIPVLLLGVVDCLLSTLKSLLSLLCLSCHGLLSPAVSLHLLLALFFLGDFFRLNFVPCALFIDDKVVLF